MSGLSDRSRRAIERTSRVTMSKLAFRRRRPLVTMGKYGPEDGGVELSCWLDGRMKILSADEVPAAHGNEQRQIYRWVAEPLVELRATDQIETRSGSIFEVLGVETLDGGLVTQAILARIQEGS